MNLIAQLRKQKGWNQDDLADFLGVTRATVSKYENNKLPLTGETLQRIAEIFAVSVDYLLGREKILPEAKSVWIPVYAYYPSQPEELAKVEIVDREEIPPPLSQKGEYLSFLMPDNSMAAKILAQDVVIIRKESTWQDGEIKAVSWKRGAVFLRRLKEVSGGVVLLPENSAYEPIFLTKLEANCSDFQIWGKLVELRRKF